MDASLRLEAAQALHAALKELRQGLGLKDDRTLRRIVPAVRRLLGLNIDEPLGSQRQMLVELIKQRLEGLEDASLIWTSLNLDSSNDDWTARLSDMAAAQFMSQRTAVRRLDKALLELATKLLRGPQGSAYQLSFADFDLRVTADGFHKIHFVVGSTQREKDGLTEAFTAASFGLDLGGVPTPVNRQVLPGTVRDLVRVVDAAAALIGRVGGTLPDEAELCVPDIAVTEEMLDRHLVLVGGPDTNLYIALAALAMRNSFGEPAPIRYRGEDSGYFTCDEIISDLSGARYLRLEESGGMHCGYLLHCINPWNRDTTLTIVSGTRATGTQAALLALSGRPDEAIGQGDSQESWRQLAANNKYAPAYSAKVVRASLARVAQAPETLFTPGWTRPIPAHERIPQRHAVNGYVFEE